MTQLTEERFEQILTEKLAPMVAKEDLQKAVQPLATKEDVDELARMIGECFDDIRERLDARERMTLVEQKLHKVGEALHITP